MRFMRPVALVVNWAVVITLGLFAIGLVLNDLLGIFVVPFNLAGRTMIIFVVGGTVLVALNVLLLWDVISRIFGDAYLKLEGGSGRINVSVKAIQDTLERALRDMAEVTAANVRVQAPKKKGRPVVISAHVNLKGNVVYHSISRAIIGVLESTFSNIVSEGAPVECHVFWEKIRQDRGASRPAAEPAASLRPRFPVEEEKEAK